MTKPSLNLPALKYLKPPKHFHPLPEKEKELLTTAVKRIVSKRIADSLVEKGSRLAHLYGLPKTYKKQLVMCPILSICNRFI